MKRQNLCALLVLASNCLALFLLFSWNDYWCRHGIYFYLPGLFFLFGSTRLSNLNGAIVAFLTGLLIDSTGTSSFGLHAFGWDAQHPRVLAQLLDIGIDAVYSDHTAKMMAAIGEA